MTIYLPRQFPILYAEDEDDDIVLMRKAFEKAGISNPLYTVSDGQKVVDYFLGTGAYADRKANPLPGLVLLDLNLPLRNGFEVLQWIRKQPEWGIIHVICSSSGQREDVEKAYRLGANGYIKKPSDFGKLVELARAIKDYWLTCNEPPFSTGP